MIWLIIITIVLISAICCGITYHYKKKLMLLEDHNQDLKQQLKECKDSQNQIIKEVRKFVTYLDVECGRKDTCTWEEFSHWMEYKILTFSDE